MATLLIQLALVVVIYFIAKQVNTNNPEMELNPIKYSLLALVAGFIGGSAFLIGDIFKKQHKDVPFIIAYIVGALFIIFNILSIFM